MNAIVPILVLLGLTALLHVARRGGLGRLGDAVRNSDRWALEDAIDEKQQELRQLEALRSKYPFSNERKAKQEEGA